jgi:carbon monoxide dehydrogenase subunit G
MKIEEEFDVAAPLSRVWPILADIPRVASCIPGAQITEKVDDRTYRALMTMKVGPAEVTYRATVVVDELDEVKHRAAMSIKGDDVKGRGGVRASIVSQASERDGKTHVRLSSDAQISGFLATIGGRLIEGVAKKTVAQFAENLASLVTLSEGAKRRSRSADGASTSSA